MRDDAAPSGSMAGSRMEGSYRNMRGPTGSARLVSGGGSNKALPELLTELRSGVGLVHSTNETVEGNETRGGKGSAREDLARGGQGPDTEPGCPDAKPRAGERGSQTGCPNPVHCTAASRRSECASSCIQTAKAAGKRRRRWDDCGEVRREVGAKSSRSLRTGPHGSLPATAGATCLHSKSRWRKTATWSADPGG